MKISAVIHKVLFIYNNNGFGTLEHWNYAVALKVGSKLTKCEISEKTAEI